jgi:benzoylformate decarboxylase
MYVQLLKCPRGQRVAAHHHAGDRVATVLSGSWNFGFGEEFDEAQLRHLAVGSIYIKPGARTNQPAVRPPAPPVSASSPIKIEFVMHTLAQVIPEEAVIVEEAASHRPAMQRYLPIRPSGGFYTMASGGLGYGLPAAVGVALGQSRRVVCLMGDGGMMYSVQALWTAVQHKVPLTVIVLRNGDYGAMKSFARQLKSKEPPPGVELPGLDFEALAAGLGLKSVRAGQADTLAETLKRAFDEEGPMLVEIAVDPDSGSIY